MIRSALLSSEALAVAKMCPHVAITNTSTSSDVKPFSRIPGPSSVPFFGNFRNLLNSTFLGDDQHVQKYFEELKALHDEYGNIVKVDLGFGKGHVVHVFDPEDARTVFAADGRQPHIVPLQETTKKYRELKGINAGLGNLNGPEWYRLRSSVQQAMMRPQAVQNYLPFSNQVVDQLVEHIKKEDNADSGIDMRAVSGRWSLESAGRIVFEKRLGALSDNIVWADKLIQTNKEIFQLSARMRIGIPFFRFFMTPNWKKMIELEDFFYGEVDTMMEEAITKLTSKNSTSDMQFASYLINRPELTRTDVKVILLSLFSDGLSTTAPMLIYNLFNIATHPDIQSQLRDEVRNALSDKKLFTSAALNRLPLLRACIKETFRMFPIGTEISRVPQKDLIVGGYEVPAGTPIDINTNVLMRSEKLYTDSTVFKPARWLREASKESHPFAFLPFGFGPRMCAGRRFAEQDLLVVLGTLINSFEISHTGTPISQIYETALVPVGNCNFMFENV